VDSVLVLEVPLEVEVELTEVELIEVELIEVELIEVELLDPAIRRFCRKLQTGSSLGPSGHCTWGGPGRGSTTTIRALLRISW
jgi:hypothetical protein